MLEKIKVRTNARFKKTNFNTFLFFLFFAVVIWIFVQFSKQYNEIINIPVRYVNVPPDKLIIPENPDVLKLRMEENGFRVAWFSLFPPTLEIDVSQATRQQNKLVYVMDDHREAIQSQLDIDFEDSEFVKEVLAIQFRQKEEKTLIVEPKIDIQYAAGYSAYEPLQLQPDSVRISGPENVLDTLSRLYTVPLTLKKVKDDVAGEVKIDTSAFKDITVYSPTVSFSVDVEKFTEGSVAIPIQLINVPEGLNVVIFPKETLLFYQVSLKRYNQVDANDFRVVADFAQLRENQDFLIPEVVEKPAFIRHIRLNEKKIQFIIKK